MRNPTLFYGAIIVAIICLICAVYYAIPGIYHPFTFSPPTEWHPTHAVAFLGLTAICVVAALINRPKSSKK